MDITSDKCQNWKPRRRLEKDLVFTNSRSGTPACRQVTLLLEKCVGHVQGGQGDWTHGQC